MLWAPELVLRSCVLRDWEIPTFARPSGTAIHTHSLRGWMLELERFTGSWSWRKGEMGCCFACTGPATAWPNVDGITGATTLLSSPEADSTLAVARWAHSSS